MSLSTQRVKNNVAASKTATLCRCSNSHYETNFVIFRAAGSENHKIGFWKAICWLTFQKTIF
jgi:hypothetical protein